MTHLLRIHIGPVQEFISAARRSRDLWFGSRLLSELSKAAARAVADREPVGLDALVFPAPAGLADLMPDSPFNVVNEIVAVVAGDPAEVARAARAAVEQCRDTLIDQTFTVLKPILQGGGTWDVAEAQLKEFVEFYWAAVPLNDDYPAARALADRLLAARKNSRTFAPVDWGRPRPKSSLDGARESVVLPTDGGDPDRMFERYRARGGEQLSGVDLLKRLGKADDDSHFPSTSHMAAMPLRHKLDQAPATAVAQWDAYLGPLPARVRGQVRTYHRLPLNVLAPYDGSLLFPSRLAEHLDGAARKAAEDKLRAFLAEAGIKLGDLNPYYALLVGDGDAMGETIKALPTVAANREFSRALAGFAAAARDSVQAHEGAVIFAGGDDVLALLPVHTAVQCAAELARTFNTGMQAALAGQRDGEGNPIRPPTFSAGVAIVHHREPLEDALELARRAEKRAKAITGKNALAVALDKRGGPPRLVAGQWGTLDRRLLDLAALHQAGVIPDRLAYQLQRSYHRLGGATATDPAIDAILALEAERIVGRKRVASGQSPVAAAQQAYVKSAVAAAASPAAAAEELVIAALLAKVNAIADQTFPLPVLEDATS